ncbi:MAG TPA: hypothetical protein DCW46_08610 [Desulfotomaculum sp.]|nr:hypothetical protein [Desulfotomaculum sp.]
MTCTADEIITVIQKQKSAYSTLKELILLTENEIKLGNWGEATQIWKMEAEIRERITDLSLYNNHSSLFTSPIVKDAFSELINEAKEVKIKMGLLLNLMTNCMLIKIQENKILNKTRDTLQAYRRNIIPSPRFIQKDF